MLLLLRNPLVPSTHVRAARQLLLHTSLHRYGFKLGQKCLNVLNLCRFASVWLSKEVVPRCYYQINLLILFLHVVLLELIVVIRIVRRCSCREQVTLAAGAPHSRSGRLLFLRKRQRQLGAASRLRVGH